LKSIQLSSRSKKRLSGADAASFCADGFFAKGFFTDVIAVLFAATFFAPDFFAADSRMVGLCPAGLPGTGGLPARLDFATDGFFSGIYGSMRLPQVRRK